MITAISPPPATSSGGNPIEDWQDELRSVCLCDTDFIECACPNISSCVKRRRSENQLFPATHKDPLRGL